MHTWRQLIALSGDYLASRKVDEAMVVAELLAARLLNCSRGFLAPHLDKEASEVLVNAMRRGLARLVKGEPIQYILGEWDFRSLTLKCDKRALFFAAVSRRCRNGKRMHNPLLVKRNERRHFSRN